MNTTKQNIFVENMSDKIITKFKDKLKQEGRTFKWFHKEYIENKSGLTYNAAALQINGYVMVCESLSRTIQEYLNGGYKCG